MIEKNKVCLYCGKEMESKTAKKRFCSSLHRVYYNRELKRGTLDVQTSSPPKIKDLTIPTNIFEPKKPMGSQKSNFTINTAPRKEEKSDIPTRNEGESALDYAARKNEWKIKQGK